ncbi:MAG: phosphate signaling complex protein PhoU [Clostridiales bacterium]|nr:phosphate signaling complex protein PhoU [Clostridiales bacterium]
MRNRFDRQLSHLNADLTDMGMMIEEAIAGAVNVVLHEDRESAQNIIEADEDIDHKERAIEALCMKMLLQQQPVARDLRKISSALKMITDMERIGDQAADICEIAMRTNLNKDAVPSQIRDMTEATIFMVNTSVEAYVKNDAALARKVIEHDNVVDGLFNEVRELLVESIKKNSEGSDQAIDVLMIAKYIEKIADHAVNIAGWVVFSIIGEHI